MDDCARAAERLTGALSDPAWQPKRSHIEGARNELVAARARIEQLEGLKDIIDQQEDEIERLRAACDCHPGSICAENKRLRAEIERLEAPWRAVDDLDWDYIMSAIGDGGRDQFWKVVLHEMRAALAREA